MLDGDFLLDLAKDGADVKDERVAQGISSLLGRNVTIITSRQHGATSKFYRPMNKKCTSPPIVLGHVEDHHFVPLKKKGIFSQIEYYGLN